jgi:hypothetical protein
VNSFISSFRPLLLAAAIIGLIEGAIALVARPDGVDQSNYLSWMYADPDPFHKFVIYKKMKEVALSDADVVQVGDSSGFHGIRPSVVTREVEGIRYFNLSCCANTGFDGYYDFVRFALSHDPNLKAVVLYLTFNNLPQPRLLRGDSKLGDAKIHEAYAGPWSILAFPSLALRPVVTDALYSLFGLVSSPRNGLTDNLDALKMMQSVQEEHGWWAEHYPRTVGDKRKQFFDQLCGADDLWSVTPESLNSAEGDFEPLVVFDKFAALAKTYGKKLIIVFHPHPCSRLNERTKQALEDALSRLKQKYSNLYVYPEGLFEHWPRETFIDADHVYLGYERFNSRRLGRFVAAALGLPTKTVDDTPVPLPSLSLLHQGEKPIWQNSGIDEGWHTEGLIVTPASGSNWRILATARHERHYLETKISNLVPDRWYLVAVAYKPIGDSAINVILRDAKGQEGLSFCDFKASEAGRRADFYDGSMIVKADSWVVCWGIIKLTQDQAFLGIDVLPGQSGPGDQRAAEAGLLLQNVSLYLRSSPDVVLDAEERD